MLSLVGRVVVGNLVRSGFTILNNSLVLSQKRYVANEQNDTISASVQSLIDHGFNQNPSVGGT